MKEGFLMSNTTIDGASSRVAVAAIRTERSVGSDATWIERRTVFCPRSFGSVDAERCARCPFRQGATLRPEDETIRCEVVPAALPDDPLEFPVGALLRGRTTSVDAALPVDALGVLGLDQPLVPIVEDRGGRYLGCIDSALVTGAVDLPPRARALLLDSARAADVMKHTPSVPEDAPVLDVAIAMARTHSRHLPVVTRTNRVAGLIRDIDLLRVAASAHALRAAAQGFTERPSTR